MELKDIKGIGEKKIALLNKLGIFTVNNLLIQQNLKKFLK